MDIFSTALNLANIDVPGDRIIDGINILPILFENQRIERLVIGDKSSGANDTICF